MSAALTMSLAEIPTMACRSSIVPDSPKRSILRAICGVPRAEPIQASDWLAPSCTLIKVVHPKLHSKTITCLSLRDGDMSSEPCLETLAKPGYRPAFRTMCP